MYGIANRRLASKANRDLKNVALCDISVFGDMVFTCRSLKSCELENQQIQEFEQAIPIVTPDSLIPVMVTPAPEPDVAINNIKNSCTEKVQQRPIVAGNEVETVLGSGVLTEVQVEEWVSGEQVRKKVTVLMDELLAGIYTRSGGYTDYNSATSGKSYRRYFDLSRQELKRKDVAELATMVAAMRAYVQRAGNVLLRRLKRRDALRRHHEAHCDVISVLLQRRRAPDDLTPIRFALKPPPLQPDTAEAMSPSKMTTASSTTTTTTTTVPTSTTNVTPTPHVYSYSTTTSTPMSDSGFTQWHAAMKMCATLPEGIPAEFRCRLWLALADKHLSSRGIEWARAERHCFSEWAHASDAELGVQIVKDLHRTGCSLFCGEDGARNQALLKKVLVAYARWNKSVGYCQGFNMLAALILQVTDRNESDALKLMIYLIEGVLPDSYFADSLRGLSVDMAVFRELLRTKLPKLSRHLDTLQVACKEGTTSYEPPLTNVFTMQWFLTLFCNCLPQNTVLRVWDLILLEGNEILLRTALAIWKVLADRIMAVRSADEFYCVMGVLMREILDEDRHLADENTLIVHIVSIGRLTELRQLREHYLYNINPWGAAPRPPDDKRVAQVQNAKQQNNRDRLVLDIGVLKKQYVKLKQRQRQAHIIFSAAVARQSPSLNTNATPVAMNHLLLGKRALVTTRRIGPPKGSIPPIRQQPQKPPISQVVQRSSKIETNTVPTTLHWKDTGQPDSSSSSCSNSSSDTELCDDDNVGSGDEDGNNLVAAEDHTQDDNQTRPSDISDLSSTTIDVPVSNPETSTFVIESETEFPQVNVTPVTLKRSESTESIEFEQFLAARVRDLKESDSSLMLATRCQNGEGEVPDCEDGKIESEERTLYARRNSQRALEIIQENSMILHRILQCQSRMSTSPEPPDDIVMAALSVADETAEADLVLEAGRVNTPPAAIDPPIVTSATGSQKETAAAGSSDVTAKSTSFTDDDEFFVCRAGGAKNLAVHDDADDAAKADVYSQFASERTVDVALAPCTDPHVKTEQQCQISIRDGTPSDKHAGNKDDRDEDLKADIAVAAFLDNYRHLFESSTSTSLLQTNTPPPTISHSHFATLGSPNKFADSIFAEFGLTSQTDSSALDEVFRIVDVAVPDHPCETQLFLTSLADVDCTESVQFEKSKARIDMFEDITRNNLNLLEIYNKKISQCSSDCIDSSKSICTDSKDSCSDVLENAHDDDVDHLTEPLVDFSLKCDYAAEVGAEADYNLERYRCKLGSPTKTTDEQADVVDDLIAIDKNSKYNSIIAYSRNLDEKFNSLILNSPKMQKNKRYTFSFDLGDTVEPYPVPKTLPRCSQSFTDFQSPDLCLSTDITRKSPDLRRTPNASEQEYVDIDLASKPTEEDVVESESACSSGPSSPMRFSKTSNSRSKYSLNLETLGESTGLKSPNRIYNPFPVSISSRQNKERAVKLGLYKK